LTTADVNLLKPRQGTHGQDKGFQSIAARYVNLLEKCELGECVGKILHGAAVLEGELLSTQSADVVRQRIEEPHEAEAQSLS